MTTVSNMARRLQARIQENQQLIDEVSLFKQQLANTRQEKRELEKKKFQLENAVQYYATAIMPSLTEIENKEVQVHEAHEKLLREVKRKKFVKSTQDSHVI